MDIWCARLSHQTSTGRSSSSGLYRGTPAGNAGAARWISMDTATTVVSHHEPGLGEEYEQEPVPLSARKSLFSVSAVWVGFPMIMTSAVFSGIVVYNLGFVTGLLAILVGDTALMGYVGTLSFLAGRSG